MNKKGNVFLISAIILIIIILGYLTFLFFVEKVSKSFDAYSLILLSIVAAIAVFFSPCSFPTLPAYLTSFYKLKEKNKKTKSALYYGSITALGIITFNIILGLLIAFLGSNFASSFSISDNTPNIYVRFFRGIIGLMLLALGIYQWKGLEIFHIISNKANKIANIKINPAKRSFIYGFFYNIIGIGCAGPILSGLILFSFSSGGFISSLTTFLLFSFIMASLMIILSILVGKAKKDSLSKLTKSSIKIKKFSSLILILVGLYLLLSSIFIKTFVKLLFPN